jgi:DNA-binding transcriptional MerR regulator
VNQLAYDPAARQTEEPFQQLYDRIADDMQSYLRRYSFDDLRELRTIGALRFAQRFALDSFSEYLAIDRRGRYHVRRLPAQNDPILQRIEGIRQRDRMFVDTLQEFYASFAAQMRPAYDQWRRESYVEVRAQRKLKSEATARKIGGALAVIAGILAQGSNSRTTRSAGAVGIAGGAYLFKSGLDKSAEAVIHTEALKELAESLSAEIAPQRIALADRTVTLTGTVQEQYAQWREILRDMYLAETGRQPSAESSD